MRKTQENHNSGARRRKRREPQTPETRQRLDVFIAEITSKVLLEREREPSKHTLTAYRLAALKILEATPENPIRFRGEKGRSNLIILRAVYAHLKSFGLLPDSLKSGVPGLSQIVKIRNNKEARKREREKKWIRPDDFRDFLKYFPRTKAGKEARRFCRVVYVTGLRKSEALNLKKQDIKVEKTHIIINVREGKGQKSRRVIVALRHLSLFAPWHPIELTIPVLDALFRQVREAAGHPEWTIHGLRHSFASNFLTICDDIYLLKEILGHSNIETTLLYSHAGIEDKQDIDAIVNRLPT